MKILFVMVDGGGNVVPQLRVAQSLRQRGVAIHVMGHEGLRSRIEHQGMPFEAFTAGAPFDPTIPRSLPATMYDLTRLASDRRLGRCAVDSARRIDADAVVVDALVPAARTEITAAGFPTIVFVHCFYRALQDIARSPLAGLLRLRGTPLLTDDSSVMQIVSARRDLDPVRGDPPVRHVGVVWQGVPTPAVATSTPRVLVSLSTCNFAGQRRMLQNVLNAVEALPVEAVVTVGPSIDASGLSVPDNASIHSWLDHDEVLATTSLVVGHGGHGTAMRALSFGVPLVVMPASQMTDQKRVGKTLETAGVGRMLPKHAGSQRIRAAMEAVLGDPAYRSAAARIGESIRESDGAEVAADAIEQFVTGRPKVSNRRS